uniref:Maturation n=1 Tax=Leviviridae sp. TaxID=2027243 RepID=A0A514D2Q6_9VIRU|nr:MAG: hypothetical protein H1BulkLitter4382_000003 [Leviviridae sp.]
MTTIDSRITYPYYLKHYYVSDNAPSPTYVDNASFDRTFGSGVNRVTGTSDPSWRIKIAKKQNASSSYFRSDIDGSIKPIRGRCIERSTAVLHRKSYTYDCRWLGPVPTSFASFSADSTLDDIALKRLKNKIASHESHFNSLLPLAELHELRKTFRDSVDLTIDFLGVVADIRKTKGRSAAKYLSKAWLTYGFGIAPVISDVSKLANTISEYILRTDHTAILTGQSSRDWTTGRRQVNPLDSPRPMTGCDLDVHSVLNHSLSYMYKGGFNFSLASSSDYGAARQFGLRLENLVPTAWELIPFSWVIDYFTTVGDYLDDTFIGTPVKLLYLNQTRRYQCSGTNRMNLVYSSPTTVTGLQPTPGVTNWRYGEFQRTVLSTLPHRIMRLRTIDEVGLHSLNKLFNLISILAK